MGRKLYTVISQANFVSNFSYSDNTKIKKKSGGGIKFGFLFFHDWKKRLFEAAIWDAFKKEQSDKDQFVLQQFTCEVNC